MDNRPPRKQKSSEAALRIANQQLEQQAHSLHAELERRQLDFRMFADNVPALFSYIDARQCIRYVNRRYEQLFQKPANEIVGQTLEQLHGPKRYSIVRPHVEAALRGEDENYEADLEFADGPRTMHIRYVPDRDARQHVQGFFALLTDVTELKRAREQIESLALFPQQNPNPVVRVCREGNVLHANPASRHLLDNWESTIGGRLPAKRARYIAEVLEAGAVHREELKLGEQTLSLEFVPIVGSDYVNIYASDVTERKQAEELSRRERQFSDAIIDNIQGIVLVLDLAGRIVRFNSYMEDLTGWRLEEAQGGDWVELFVPARDQGSIREVFGRAIGGERTRGHINSILTKDGRELEIEWYDAPLTTATGELIGLLCTGRNVTESKRNEHALRQSEERMRAILNTAADAIITIDRRGVITDVNLATETMFGYTRDELVGENVNILMPSPYRDEHDQYLARYLQTGEARLIGIGREVVGLRKDGTTLPVGLAVSQVDHLGLFTGIIRDLSERKRLEKHVLDVAAEEQRRIGHELHDGTGQELTALALFAGKLLDILGGASRGETEEKATWLLVEADFVLLREIASRLLRGLKEANRNVHEILRGIMPVQVDAEGLRSALEDLAATANLQGDITCRFESSGPVAIPDKVMAGHLYRIAQEALHNALRHSRADEICISLSQNNQQIVVAVNDNGIGISQNAMYGAGLASGGMGLRTMEYRAGMIGGAIRIGLNEAGGTMVRCTVD